ncbi:hypothetical protein VTO42DRAFT_8760 [Malbranchea cinnamomea]
MLTTISRPDDTVRPLRAYRGDTNGDLKEQNHLPATSANYVVPRDEPLPRTNRPASSKLLTPEQVIHLAQRAVDTGIQETKRSLAGSEGVESVVRPKLTIDLGHSSIGMVPDSMVDIIKDEVARLSLSNNHIDRIPARFSECVHLRYLNIRANNFTEFPKEVYNLSFLEILDLSRNKITAIPAEIRNLTSLRVLSMMQNLLEDLPDEISEMSKLQVFKVTGNPLKNPLKSVLEMKEAELTSSKLPDNEKESSLTAELKRFLKSRQPLPQDAESISGSTETLTDIPRAPKRGDRFPVIPQANRSDSRHDPRSPSYPRPPPIPTRSHHRIASAQSNGSSSGTMQHRSGTGGSNSNSNERNRSNSEGFIQASITSRSRRMAFGRKYTDLGTLDETRPYRNSHLRGLSHGSVLRAQSAHNEGSSPPIPGSPRGRKRETPIPRLSSIPEHQTKSTAGRHPVIDAAKGTLYSLFQVHYHISTLVNVITEDKRSPLEIIFHNAALHLDQLNETLEKANRIDSVDVDRLRKTVPVIKHECEACITAYIHVGSQLRAHASKMVSLTEPKYVRSLMLMMYNSLIELRNAAGFLGVDVRLHGANTKAHMAKRSLRDRIMEPVVTPTREPQPPQRRYRSDTTIQHVATSITYPPPPPPPTSATYPLPPSPPPPPVSLSLGSRSRSNSRSNAILNPSSASSMANTPRSGESFPTIPTTTTTSSRINPVTGLDEFEEDRVFERIFHQLTAGCRYALQGLPLATRQFSHYLEMTEDTKGQQSLHSLWSRLIGRCRICQEASEALHARLLNMKVKEPGGGTRNQREFWQLCKTFIQSFVDLIIDMREVKQLGLLPQEIVAALRPVQKANKEAGRLIDASPWSHLAELNSSNTMSCSHPQTPGSAMSNTSTIPSGFSPQSVHIPVTPLGAALGAAAQATVPSTPASASSDRFFAGDVFQRADSLLSMPTVAPILTRR